MMDKRRLLASAFGGSILALAAAPAVAQDGTVDELVITAQKREQSVYDVGGAVSVAGGEQLTARRVEQVKDLAAFTPNLDIKEQVPGAMPVITIRGVGLDDFSSTNNPSAGIYIDEVYLASLAQMNFDFFDLERVELLKGPQGTLYGRNSTAGALNILTAKPKLGETQARLAGGFGAYEAYEAEGMINLPLGENAAFRFAAKTIQQREGFWFNRADNRDIGRRDVWMVRAQLRATPSEGFDLVFKLEGQRARSELGQSEFFGQLPSPTPGVSCPGDPRCTDFFGYSDPDGDPFKGDWSGDNFYDIDQWSATLRLDWDLGDATLTSVSGFAAFERSFYVDVDSTPLRQTDFIQNDDITQWSQELRLAGSTPNLEWLIGGFYSFDQVETDNPAFFDHLFNTRAISGADQETRSAAVFGHGEWSLSDTLSLVAGLRYTWEEKSNEASSADLVPFCPASFLTMVPCGAGPVPLAFIDETISDTNWSWKVGLNWKPAEDVLVYGLVSQGVKSGGFFSGFATSSTQFLPYEPETLIAFEVGAKARIGPDLQASAALFRYDYSDVQTFITDTSGPIPVQRLGNVDEAELTGFEAELTWTPGSIEGLTAQAGLGLLRTELGGFATAGGPIPAGNDLPNAPELTFNGSLQYEATLSPDWSLTVLGSARYSAEAFKDALNDPLLVQDEYWLFDGRLTLANTAGDWELALWGRNLTDERYVVQGLNLGALGFGNRSYNAPRTWGVSISKRW